LADGSPGTVNTGGGGGGAESLSNAVRLGGVGGSGVVIIKLPRGVTVTKGASHTMTTTNIGFQTIYTFTAGDDNITIA
jgi:hypothetical protein